MNDVAIFESQRPQLFAIAYRMLGSAAEAEDILQDAFLRYAAASPAEIRSPRAYLGTIVTRLCLDQLKAARTTREQYIGPWLPEPILTSDLGADPAHDAERYESITLAFLVLMEALAPLERAVFVLREVFEYEYDEIAAMLAISPANGRQVFHRAKERIAAGRPRFQAEPEQQRRLVERFVAATAQGDVAGLTSLLAADVTYTADGGGKMPAARQPLAGRDVVLKIVQGLARAVAVAQAAEPEAETTTLATVNAEPAILFWDHGRLDTAFVCSVADGQIRALRAIRNPAKLAYLQCQLAHPAPGSQPASAPGPA